MDPTETYHGGDLREAEALFGRAQTCWLDLSTGINPEPYPNTSIDNVSWRRLPQTSARDALLVAARRYYEVPEPAGIVAAPGSQTILQLLPMLFPAGTVSVVGPTYAEHTTLWTAHGHQVVTVDDISKASDTDIVVVVNPNNPDGRTVNPAELLELAQSLSPKLGHLIVDEAFADIDPATGVLPRLQDERVLAIRSFGKFFGLPGLRLGFAAGAPETVAQLRWRLGPWAVSGPALEIGARAFADGQWIERTRARLIDRADALDSVLTGAGLHIVGGTPLFRLVEHIAAPPLFDRLGRAGIFVRRFQDRPDRLRFGVPGNAQDLQRLKRALS